MRISFLINSAYGIGGTIRTTFNLAEQLAQQHEVEVVSVFRNRERPLLAPDGNVPVRYLVDLRRQESTFEGDDPENKLPSRVFARHDGAYDRYSLLTDRRIGAYLATTDADVVIGTRPGLNTHLVRQARRGPVLLGQEHLTYSTHPPRLQRELRALYPRLDALITVTEKDARDYRRLWLPGVRVESVPNSVPDAGLAPADGRGKWVIAAGRLARMKRYDLLIRAFAQVVEERPDWRLRIYGGGVERQKLRELVERLGLYNHVFLMGPVSPLEPEWGKGAIAAVSSSFEPFGMTIVEAMRAGLPVVATDCPHGPGEIITPGVDGQLVPNGDVKAMGAALLGLINDDEKRAAMGRAARERAHRYDPATIGERYDRLLTELVARRGPLRSGAHRARGALVGRAYAARNVAGTVRQGVGYVKRNGVRAAVMKARTV
ncbi:glycosyltransferase family 4 protein [Streptomyces sp. TRM66268-LWL]|uniref:D-inositol 3-phosphate glycosyltransferase n=1 Tax=Streptomyces polyasparticus TaxID=2767826 RepID=A0ABR7SK23_9ACTN|nr:glycosyltransferase family 4 protein [Streptomyces polyasparticus]MBC9715304.1 glycosyltransferase family 4 protein [Streptomyces polyasparticus]